MLKIVCSICGSPCEFIEKEGVWRHEGKPFDPEFLGQIFCDRYGYPVRPHVIGDVDAPVTPSKDI